MKYESSLRVVETYRQIFKILKDNGFNDNLIYVQKEVPFTFVNLYVNDDYFDVDDVAGDMTIYISFIIRGETGDSLEYVFYGDCTIDKFEGFVKNIILHYLDCMRSEDIGVEQKVKWKQESSEVPKIDCFKF